MFAHLEPFAGDPILGINALFQADPRPGKVNLSIGVYLDEQGQVPLLPSVHEAERRLLERAEGKPYLPIEGTPSMRRATASLLFGEEAVTHHGDRIVTVQTVGSSGALKIAAEFIKCWLPACVAWVSTPTWENHVAIFEGSGVQVHRYPYYDPLTAGLDAEGMMAGLRRLPRHGVVVLHGCCHNPTGVDLSAEQWQAVVDLLKERALLPLVDLAYQGFSHGLEEDALPLRAMAAAGMTFLVASSFSKNMSLYGERAGALSVHAADAEEARLVFGQLQAIIRRNWSNPPMHANRVVDGVLNDPDLRERWVAEVAAMRERIERMRQMLHEALRRCSPTHRFDYLLNQRGMFSYTGLSRAQVRHLREDSAVYLVESGRLCVAGLNTGNVPLVARAIADVL